MGDKQGLQPFQYLSFKSGCIVGFADGIGLDKVVWNLSQLSLLGDGCSNGHLPVKLPRIARDDFRTEMAGDAHRQRRLANPGRTEQYDQCWNLQIIQWGIDFQINGRLELNC